MIGFENNEIASRPKSVGVAKGKGAFGDGAHEITAHMLRTYIHWCIGTHARAHTHTLAHTHAHDTHTFDDVFNHAGSSWIRHAKNKPLCLLLLPWSAGCSNKCTSASMHACHDE